MDLEAITKALEKHKGTAFIRVAWLVCQGRGGKITVNESEVTITSEDGLEATINPSEICEISGVIFTHTIVLEKEEDFYDLGTPTPTKPDTNNRVRHLKLSEIKQAIDALSASPLGTDIKFCQICLGANFPGQPDRPENGWCCGAWCDGIREPLGICTSFQLDRGKLQKLTPP